MRQRFTSLLVDAAERGAPDRLVRRGMRIAIERRLREERNRPDATRDAWLREWNSGPIALVPQSANDQHYEVPAAFFELVLGPRLKYSGCLWSEGVDDLAAAEEQMLGATCSFAELEDGMEVLDLGCGWGSLSLWIAENHPGCTVTAVSNSRRQGEFIESRAAEAGLSNVTHRVMDVNDFEVGGRFDRVFSVEMFEHVRNHTALLDSIAGVLAPGGALFVHYFSHRSLWWPFEDRAAGDWMARTFFSGGVMPSHDLFDRISSPFEVRSSRWYTGDHYQRTLDAWLARLDAHPESAAAALQRPDEQRWLQRWRMFFMACSELFGYDGGRQWGVSHHLLEL
jgi:cyclopropane-fatty-acyl-phospholipid synthase